MKNLTLFQRTEKFIESTPPFRYFVRKWQSLKKLRYIRRWERQKKVDSKSLKNFERKVYSQFGEDGVLEEIFKRIGCISKFCVEFGIEDGSECNCRLLLQHQNWKGVLIDGSLGFVSEAKELYRSNDGVIVHNAFIDAENILSLFEDYGVPSIFDLLSVDIDGNDYWVLKQILNVHRPRVIVTEYNGRFEPPVRWVMKYNPTHRWEGDANFGASLGSFVDLLEAADYTLVHCNLAGNNAFFVSNSELNESFSIVIDALATHYTAPLYSVGFGHPL